MSWVSLAKPVVARFFVDEDLVVEDNTVQVLEKTNGHDVLARLLESIKETAPTLAAKAALGPISRSHT